MSHHLVSMIDVHYAYAGGSEVLGGVDFAIHHGESVGLVGSNGAGKSTLLLHLVGVLFPCRGEVRVGDWPVRPETLEQVRRSAGLVFQDPDDQLFMPTVEEDVGFGPRCQNLPEEEVEQRIRDALIWLGILHLRQRPSHQLSGGERRAAAIATVLAQSPDVLLLDEPTAGLDPQARRRVMSWIARFEHTRLVASHDLDLVLEVCERTIVLQAGRVVADGPSLEVLGNEELLSRVGLELPLRLQGCPRCSKAPPAFTASERSSGPR